MNSTEVVSGLESGSVVDVVGVERDAEEAGVGPVSTAREAGACVRRRGTAAQSRHFLVDHFYVEVGKLHVVALCLSIATNNPSQVNGFVTRGMHKAKQKQSKVKLGEGRSLYAQKASRKQEFTTATSFQYFQFITSALVAVW